jgi:hypothetical protein
MLFRNPVISKLDKVNGLPAGSSKPISYSPPNHLLSSHHHNHRHHKTVNCNYSAITTTETETVVVKNVEKPKQRAADNRVSSYSSQAKKPVATATATSGVYLLVSLVKKYYRKIQIQLYNWNVVNIFMFFIISIITNSIYYNLHNASSHGSLSLPTSFKIESSSSAASQSRHGGGNNMLSLSSLITWSSAYIYDNSRQLALKSYDHVSFASLDYHQQHTPSAATQQLGTEEDFSNEETFSNEKQETFSNEEEDSVGSKSIGLPAYDAWDEEIKLKKSQHS